MVDRVHEILTVTPRLYDYHPEGQEALLLDTIVRLRASGVPWEEVYKEEVGTVQLFRQEHST